MKYIVTLICLLLIPAGSICAQTVPMPTAPGQNSQPQMSEKELQEFYEMMEFLSTLDEKELQALEQLGRDVLISMSINPDDPEQLAALFNEQPVAQAPVPTTTEQVAEPLEPKAEIVSTETHAKVRDMLTRLIAQLNSLRQKVVHSSPDNALRTWRTELDDLVFYLTVINKKEHHERLITKEFAQLLKQIRQLADAMNTHEPLFVIRDTPAEDFDDPYEILGISSSATEDEIEEAFYAISENKDPEIVKKRLTTEGVSGKDLERAVKEARRSFNIIQDAHEKLIDAKLRAQVDREHSAQITYNQAAHKSSDAALQSIIRALTNSLYNQLLLTNLEAFLKKYEPQELAKKKQMEQSEALRRKEQEAAGRTRAYPSPGGPFEPTVRLSGGGSSNAPGYYGGSGYDPYGGYPDYGGYNQQQLGGTPGTSPAAASSKGGPSAKPKDEKKTEDKKEDSGKKGQKAAKGESPKALKNILELFTKVQDDLKKFKEVYNQPQPAVKKLFTDLPSYMHTDITAKPINAKLNDNIDEFMKNAKLDDLQKHLKSLRKSLEKGVSERLRARYLDTWKPLYNDFYKKDFTELLTAIQDSLDPNNLDKDKAQTHLATQQFTLAQLAQVTEMLNDDFAKIESILNPPKKKTP